MIVELRQYTLHPGQRDVLIDLFERNFVAGQEDAGISVLGWFRDLGDPDKFVWLRAFPTMQARAESLHRFYFGPVWQAHREKANATMIDSDDVLLLHTEQQLVVPEAPFTATLCFFDGQVPGDGLRTLHAENTFPQLPIRTGENVLVLLGPGEVPQGAVKTQQLRLG